MHTAANIIVGLIALVHVYILVLEMFLWDKPAGLRAFGQTQEAATASKVLAANQGLRVCMVQQPPVVKFSLSKPFLPPLRFLQSSCHEHLNRVMAHLSNGFHQRPKLSVSRVSVI